MTLFHHLQEHVEDVGMGFLDLIEKHRHDPKAKATWVDYVVVVVGLGLAVLSIVLPIFIIYGLGLGAVLGIGSLFEG